MGLLSEPFSPTKPSKSLVLVVDSSCTNMDLIFGDLRPALGLGHNWVGIWTCQYVIFSTTHEHNFPMAEMVVSEILMRRECFGKRRARLITATSRGCAARRRRPRWQSAASPAARSRTSRAGSTSPSARTVTMPGLEIIPGWSDCSSEVLVL